MQILDSMNFERQSGIEAPDGVRVTRISRRRWMVEYDDGEADSGAEETGDGTAQWWVAYTNHAPDAAELRREISAHINSLTDAAIIGGMTWEGDTVWLSMENQFNYKAVHDAAVQSLGASLPVTFKLGTDSRPVYHEFATLADLQAFYAACLAHVQHCYTAGWQAKDRIAAQLPPE